MPTHFDIIDDFNAQSRKPVCSITNLPKQSRENATVQAQPHEIDDFILRGPDIDFEGFFDIRPVVIIETAREVFGMVDGEAYEFACHEAARFLQYHSEEVEAHTETKARLESMIQLNADLISRKDEQAEVAHHEWEVPLPFDALLDISDSQVEL
jgi:hypothetical protein